MKLEFKIPGLGEDLPVTIPFDKEDWQEQVQAKVPDFTAAGTPVDIYLSLYFNDGHAIPLPCADLLGMPNGQVKFGIQRAQLKLSMYGCALTPYPLVPNHLFEVSFVKPHPPKTSAIRLSQSLKSTGSKALGSKFKVGTKPPVEPAGTHLNSEVCHYTWHIAPLDKHQGLKGLAADIKLGHFVLPETSCRVQAALSIDGPDVVLYWDHERLRSDLNGNKLILLDRALVLNHLGPQLAKQPLSMTSWTYE